MQYIYSDGDLYYFMDQETYEQTPIHQDKIGDGIKFLKEEMVCKVVSYKGDIFQVELPITVILEITECEPGVKGDTANNASKYATLETGAVVKVPLFVNQGETIRVDTRTGEYLERA
jgi:elongation factor P